MKPYFRVTTASAVVVAVALSSGVAAAQDESAFYASIIGGYQDRQRSGESPETYTLFDSGWLLGVAGGYRYADFRFELEYTAFKNDAKTVASEPTGPLPALGSVSGEAYMLNAYYDVPVEGWVVRPYVGLGVGVYQTKLKGLSNEFLANAPADIGGPFFFNERSDHPFAWQVRLGANYAVNEQLHVGVGYRYFRGDTLLIRDTPFGDLKPSGAKLNVLEVGLRYEF